MKKTNWEINELIVMKLTENGIEVLERTPTTVEKLLKHTNHILKFLTRDGSKQWRIKECLANK